MIHDGSISGGMIPKVLGCLESIDGAVLRVRISLTDVYRIACYLKSLQRQVSARLLRVININKEEFI